MASSSEGIEMSDCSPIDSSGSEEPPVDIIINNGMSTDLLRIHSCPLVRSLNIGYDDFIQTLDLSDMPLITSIPWLTTAIPKYVHLTKLSLSEITMTGTLLQYVSFVNLHQLKSVTFTGTFAIGDINMAQLPELQFIKWPSYLMGIRSIAILDCPLLHLSFSNSLRSIPSLTWTGSSPSGPLTLTSFRSITTLLMIASTNFTVINLSRLRNLPTMIIKDNSQLVQLLTPPDFTSVREIAIEANNVLSMKGFNLLSARSVEIKGNVSNIDLMSKVQCVEGYLDLDSCCMHHPSQHSPCYHFRSYHFI
jgi:hypothetical protein